MGKESEIKLLYLSPLNTTELIKEMSFLTNSEFEAPRMLKNRYFDDETLSLNENRVALRVREFTEVDGRPRFIQTLKNKGVSIGGLHQRGEWEWELKNTDLDASILKGHPAWPIQVDVATLWEVFSTDFNRVKSKCAFNSSEIEIAIDTGAIKCNGINTLINEIEIELLRGEVEDLFNLALAIAKRRPVIPWDVSKAERGYSLYRHSLGELEATFSLPDIELQNTELLEFMNILPIVQRVLIQLLGSRVRDSVGAENVSLGDFELNFFHNSSSELFEWLKKCLESISANAPHDEIDVSVLEKLTEEITQLQIEEGSSMVSTNWGYAFIQLARWQWLLRSE